MRLVLIIGLLFSIFTSSAQSVKRAQYVKNDSVFIEIINPFLAPVEVTINALDSTSAFIKTNTYGLLKPNDTLKQALVIPLKHIADTSAIDVKDYVSFKASFGNPNTSYDEDYAYDLPYPKEKSYNIMQSFGGKFSHNRPHSKYAIDFELAVGDTITAARSGRVFYVKEDSKEHCPTRKCVNMGNKIYILHEDGTMAHYVHLDYEGALVNVGDWVEAKQPIAISGMTGFTTKPHLHFVLYKSGQIAIPYSFKGMRNKKLKQGKFYRNKF